MRPPEKVRRYLAAERSAGSPFEPAWRRALASALDDVDGNEARAWRGALEWARPAFESAYRREPSEAATLATAALALAA